MHKKIIIVYGPTGVGKSEYALDLGGQFPLELINADVGQLYVPLSIGTAKPNWKHEPMPHHLFDFISEPIDFSVVEYKKEVLALCEDIWNRGSTPLLVGGSGFYLKSLFFPCKESTTQEEKETTIKKEFYTDDLSTQEAWNLLHDCDPIRALQIHQNDRYRIERALKLIEKTGSAYTLQPTYQDLKIPILIIGITRERTDLYNRINQRTQEMITAGWIEEVKNLQKTLWIPFLKRKKLIGYDDIITFLENQIPTEKDYAGLLNIITQKTRNYAKRQMTFWRMLKKDLSIHFKEKNIIYELLVTDKKKTSEELKSLVFNFLKGK